MSTPLFYQKNLIDRYKLIYDWIPEGTQLALDIGCGNGVFSNWLSERTKRLIATDHNAKHVGFACEQYPKIFGGVASAGEALPYPDETFDVVIMSDVLEHMNHDASAVDEVLRILKPGGHLIISLPNKSPLQLLDGDNVVNRLIWLLAGLRIPKGGGKKFYEGFKYVRHRHYSFNDLMALVGDRATVAKKYYGGTLIWPLAYLVEKVMEVFFKKPIISTDHTFLRNVRAKDFKRSFASWSYNLVVDLQKI